MLKKITLTLFIAISHIGFSQNYGYFGKKNNLTINAIGAIPIFYWLTTRNTPNYKKKGDGLTRKNDLFDAGLSLSITRTLSGNFALGFEYDLIQANAKAPRTEISYTKNGQYPYTYDYFHFPIYHEQFAIQTHVFMPKIEYTIHGSSFPIGINNQLGMGYTITNVREKDYVYSIDLDESVDAADSISIVNGKVLDYSELKSIQGFTFMYAFNIRKPISKHFLINYGIRYTLNITVQDASSKSNYYMNSSEIINSIASKRFASIMSFNFGLTYVF